MPELFDTARVPDDPEYWDALAERVAAHAAREAKGSGFDWLAHSRASWVGASLLLAAAALALMVLPAEDLSTGSFITEWAQALAPADDMGRAIVLDDDPPAIGSLLLGGLDGSVR